jgi:hypothetical protein
MLELLVEAGESSAEQYELLRWVRCLSPQGLADRAGVLTVLDDVARESEEAARSPAQSPTSDPTVPQIQVGELRSAGYLDEAGCTQFDTWPGEWETVSRIVAEVRAARKQTGDAGGGSGGSAGAGGVSVQPADTVDCQTCGRRVPVAARYCGYCGIRVQPAREVVE